ncbi:hypothetical protein C2S52_003853 [Perilla frutescens var. hirtella]|nr:hypothetical protein C2S51_011683 [Perilla frutescens var. frutescens]KAH6793376.1 hypothetical protein C2S52_003853 [Perilla frutescens var. hirtella]
MMDFFKLKKFRNAHKPNPKNVARDQLVPQPEEPKNGCGDALGKSVSVDSDNPEMEEDDDDFITNETSSSEWRDVEAEGRQFWSGFDAVYDIYCDRMLFFDRSSSQQLQELAQNHVGSHVPSTPSPKSASKKLASPLACLSLRKFEPPEEEIEHLQHPVNNPYQDLETAYVAQVCLTWEALHCQYTQLSRKIACQPDSPTSYNQSAQQFQQFQVLLQRFIENEPFEQGSRPEIFARTRRSLPKLLQVPKIQASSEERSTGEEALVHTVDATDLMRVMECSILSFREFVKTDKKKSGGVRSIFGSQNQMASPVQQQVQSSLEKKAMKVKELWKRSKSYKKKSWPSTAEDVEMLLGLIDVKVLSRALRMMKIRKEEVFWCEEKMKKLEVGRSSVSSSSSLFSPESTISVDTVVGSGSDICILNCSRSYDFCFATIHALTLPQVLLNKRVIIINKATMATENPMRIVDSSGAGKWSPSRSTASFASAAAVTDELGLLLRGHNIDRNRSNIAPNRSGSAPPSIEGSFAAFGDLINKQPLPNSNPTSLSSGLENSPSENLLQDDLLYSTYLNSDLNARLHPHTISRSNIHLARQSGVSGNNWRLPSGDGRGNGSVYIPGSSLSTHEEEPEGDRSPKETSDDGADTSIVLERNALSSSGRHKSLVDLIQEDFPRTPSPVFSQNHSSGHVEEPFNHDVQNLTLDSLSIESSKPPEPKSGGSTAQPKDELTCKDAYFTSDFVSGHKTDSDASKSVLRVESDKDKQGVEFDDQDELHVQTTHSQHAAGYNVPGSQLQGTSSQSFNNYTAPQGHVKVTSVEMQPLLHSPGAHPPLYATTAAYMAPANSFYTNFSTSGLYSPQYSGYAMGSSYLPPYLPGYPPHTSFPFHFNANSGQGFGGQSAGVPTGENISKGSVMQNMNRFYGQHGLTIQPTFPDPLSMQYFQGAVQDPYGVSLQYNQLHSPGDQKFQLPPSGSVGIPSPRKMGIPSSSYLSSPTSLGFVPQFRSSPHGSPVLPDSPVGGPNSMGKRYDVGFSQNSAKNVGGYPRWQGQRGADGINDHRKHSFLEELKASSARRIDLSDIVGRIVEFSVDQHGSRFIQQKLENCSVEEKELVFREVLPHASKLMTDVFGNYVIQKFFEHGTYEQRKELASQLSRQMLPLSLQMYGCRVIQKALEVIEVDQKTELVLELDGHVMRCVRDQNGNHVIQKCIECVPAEKIDFIISAFRGQVATLSTHPYGCRVIQRVLEHCSDDLRCRPIVDEIMESAYDLAHDQYGNYVTQHVLERGRPFERSQIIDKLSGRIVPMSQHKYASNVVEKCLEYGDSAECERLIEEILAQPDDTDNLLTMMKDQYANYVVQKIIEICNENQRERLLDCIQLHIVALKKYTYGKHIVARFEQLTGEDDESSEV